MSIRSVRLVVIVLAFTAPLEAQEIEIGGRLADVADAEIVLVPAEDGAATGPETAAVWVRTGEDGSFQLVAPGAGMWRLKVAPAAGVPLVNTLRPFLEQRVLGAIEVPEGRRQSVRERDGEGAGVAGLRLVAWGTSRLPPEMRSAGWSLHVDGSTPLACGALRPEPNPTRKGASSLLSAWVEGFNHAVVPEIEISRDAETLASSLASRRKASSRTMGIRNAGHCPHCRPPISRLPSSRPSGAKL